MSAKYAVIGAGAAVLLSAVAIAPVPASAACRGSVQGLAEGTFKYPTELLSRARWRTEVREKYGAGYAFWSKAEDKTTRCHKEEPGEKWRCVARARPCN